MTRLARNWQSENRILKVIGQGAAQIIHHGVYSNRPTRGHNRDRCLIHVPIIDCLVELQRHNSAAFYRAMLCIRGTSHGPVSVCVCVRLSQVGVLLKRQNVG